MKKIIALLFIGFIAIFAEAVEIGKNGNYTVVCERCKKLTYELKKGYSSCMGCHAWRRYDLEISHYEVKYNAEKKDYERVLVSGVGQMIYKCPHGHTFYIPYQDGK